MPMCGIDARRYDRCTRGRLKRTPSMPRARQAMLATVLFWLPAAILVRAQLTIDIPSTVQQCDPVVVRWQGGQAPFTLQAQARFLGSQADHVTLYTISGIMSNDYTWIVTADASKDVLIFFDLQDSTGVEAETDAVPLRPGSSNACMNSSLPPGTTLQNGQTPTQQIPNPSTLRSSSSDTFTSSTPNSQSPLLPSTSSRPPLPPPQQTSSQPLPSQLAPTQTPPSQSLSSQTSSLPSSSSATQTVHSASLPTGTSTWNISPAAFPSGTPPPVAPKKSLPVGAVVGAILGGVGLIILLLIGILYFERRTLSRLRRRFSKSAYSGDHPGSDIQLVMKTGQTQAPGSAIVSAGLPGHVIPATPSGSSMNNLSPFGGRITTVDDKTILSYAHTSGSSTPNSRTTTHYPPSLAMPQSPARLRAAGPPPRVPHDEYRSAHTAPPSAYALGATPLKRSSTIRTGASALSTAPLERQVAVLQAQLDRMRQEQQVPTSPDPTTLALMREVASLRVEIEEIRQQDRDTESLPGYSSIYEAGGSSRV